MGFMDWNDRFSIGVPAMDAQHQTLIAAMNDLHRRATEGAPAAEVLRRVDDLAAKTAKHFAEEEAYMASIGFDGLAQHQIIHRKLLERLGGHREAIAKTGQAGDDLFTFLRHWLSSHICGIDTRYAAVAAAR